jgi:hypothetical protein
MSTKTQWIPGDKPDIPEGTEKRFWVTLENTRTGKRKVVPLTYCNAHVMPLCDEQDEPPGCAVPHNPNEYGECDEYEWTCWHYGHCDTCEACWVFNSTQYRIVAYMPGPEPYEGPKQEQKQEDER